jgi:hypothetical protein
MKIDATISSNTVTVQIGKNPFDPADIPEAKEVARLYKELGNRTDPIFKKFKLNVPEANRILRIMDLPEFFEIPLSAVRVGELVFAGVPGEPFQKIGLEVKADSPYEMTFVTCCTNGSNGYFPTADAFAEAGYERSTSPFAWDCAEIVTNGLKQVIGEMKK